MTSDYINETDIKILKILLEQIENDYYLYTGEYDEDIDYEDLKKEIFNIQKAIKGISEKWAE